MTQTRTAKRSGKPKLDPAQLGLFDGLAPALIAPVPLVSLASKPLPVPAPKPVKRTPKGERIVSESDMPDYPADLASSVDQSIRSIPTDRVLLTYREIQDYFGVSRATVTRRMKDGLVPGIRLVHGRVLDDGPVRRLDRTQVRWLLLAVRRSRHTA